MELKQRFARHVDRFAFLGYCPNGAGYFFPITPSFFNCFTSDFA